MKKPTFANSAALAMFSASALVAGLILPACRVGPDYHRPAPLGTNALAAAYSGSSLVATGEWKVATPSAHLPRGNWWSVFGDAELDRLEKVASANNQQIAAALARFEQARALVTVSQAGLLPQISADPGYDRQRTSRNQPENGHPAGVGRTYNTFTLPLSVGWEADLWGRVRREVESARARADAGNDDLEAARLAILAELASDYFNLRQLDREYALIVRTIETYRRSLDLVINRRKGGVATDLDVSQAETQLRTAEAELPALRLQREQVVSAMAVLCGQPLAEFVLNPASPQEFSMPEVPPGLPSELLERRPDIAAAEKRVASANAQIGVAQSAFYPRLRFDGLAGLQSINAGTLFQSPSRFWSVGPTLQLPLFTGGANRAQLAYSRAAYDETVANYRLTVLHAFQEVEDQLAARVHLRDQLEAEALALKAAQKTLQIANNRYQAGLVTYLEVATAQSSALSLEQTVVQLRARQLVSSVGLIKALGGGWEQQTSLR